MSVKATTSLTTSDHSDRLTADAVAAAAGPLQTHFVDSTGSTSDLAAELLSTGRLIPPAVVVADIQTAGRGRMGRRWHSGDRDPTGVTATFIFRQLAPAPHHLPLLVAVLVRRALAEFDDAVGIKWPNDLLLREGKVAGILCERKNDHDLIGVGVNVRPVERSHAEPDYSVASLGDTASPPQRLAVLRTLCQSLTMMPALSSDAWAAHRAEYERHHLFRGRMVEMTWHDTTGVQRTSGACHGTDVDGRLRVGERVFATGSVRIR